MPPIKVNNINLAAHSLSQEEAKSQTLPCFSMVSTGGCSYECYCKFVHDDRMLIDKRFGVKSGRLPRSHDRRNTTEKGFVLFYWPPMHGKTNAEGKQRYDLHHAAGKLGPKNYSYLCLVSMWNHYLDTIAMANACEFASDEEACAVVNPITKRKRLPIFRELSMSNISRPAEPVPLSVEFKSNSCDLSILSDTTLEELSDNDSFCDFGVHGICPAEKFATAKSLAVRGFTSLQALNTIKCGESPRSARNYSVF